MQEFRTSSPRSPACGAALAAGLQKGERTPAIRYSAALQRAVHAPITGSQHPDGRRFAGTRWRVQRSMLATCCAALHSCGRLGTSRFNSRSFTKGVAIHERRSARTHFNSPSMHALNAHSERGVGGPGRLGLVSDVGRGHQGRSAATGSRTPPAGPPCDGPVQRKSICKTWLFGANIIRHFKASRARVRFESFQGQTPKYLWAWNRSTDVCSSLMVHRNNAGRLGR